MNIQAEDGAFSAYVARPQILTAPAVIVIQEIFGVNADIRATCDEFAAKGFLAVAPDLFWRDAPGLDLNKLDEAEWARGFELYNAFNVDRGVRDIAATIAAVRDLPECSGKVGVVGFCMGGLMAFLTAARTDVDVAVGYYGAGTEDRLDDAATISCPLMLHLGEEDEFISKSAQARIRIALAGHPGATVYSYRGCAHAFARHRGAHFDAAAATDANSRTEAVLRQVLCV